MARATRDAGARARRPCSRSAAPRWRCGSSRAPPRTRSSTAPPTASGHRALQQDFGDEAVLVLVQGRARRARCSPRTCCACCGSRAACRATSPDTRRGSGEPARTSAASWRGSSPAKAVYGPGTFVNTAATRIAEQFTALERGQRRQAERGGAGGARARRPRAATPPAEQRAACAQAARRGRAARSSSRHVAPARPALRARRRAAHQRPELRVRARVRRRRREPGVPKSRFGYLFPSANAALIQIRMRPDLTEAERRRAIELVEEAAEAAGLPADAGRDATSSRACRWSPRRSPTRCRTRSSSCSWPRCS